MMSQTFQNRRNWIGKVSPWASVGGGVMGVLVLLGLAGRPTLEPWLACVLIALALTPLALRKFPNNRWIAVLPLSAAITALTSLAASPEAAATFAVLAAGATWYALSRERGWWAAQVASGIGAGVAFCKWMTHHFAVQTLAPYDYRMVIGATVGLFFVSVALSFENPSRGIAKILSKDGPGGLLARRLLPYSLIVPGLLWWAHVKLDSLGVFRGEAGVALFVTIAVVLLITLFALTAFKLDDAFEAEREAREKLVGTTQMMNSIVEHLPNMIFMKDAQQLRFVLFNKAGEELLGFPREALLGKNDYDFFPKEQADFFTVKDREILQSKGVVDIPEEPIDTKIKGRRFLHTKKVALLDEGGEPKYLLGISEDISSAKETEQRVAEAQQMLLYSAKMSALGEMAGSIAHEINNPLSVIMGNVEELQDACDEGKLDTPTVVRITKMIEGTVDRITKIVKGLRAFSRDAEGEPFQPNRLSEIVEETLALCRQRFSNHQVRLDIPAFSAKLMIDCRRVQISQVILNLLNNSFDSVLKESERWVRLTVTDEVNFVRLAVTDSGPGVPPHLTQRIFVPFFSTKEIGKGTGLGLSISRAIMDAHHGELTLVGTGRGTEFSIRVPKKQPDSYATIAV